MIYITHAQLCKTHNHISRSSCPEVLCKKVVLKNFTEFTGKHLFQFFSKFLSVIIQRLIYNLISQD